MPAAPHRFHPLQLLLVLPDQLQTRAPNLLQDPLPDLLLVGPQRNLELRERQVLPGQRERQVLLVGLKGARVAVGYLIILLSVHVSLKPV